MNRDCTNNALNRISTIVAEGHDLGSPDVTECYYNLNSKPVYRKYPSGVVETRSFDAMGRVTAVWLAERLQMGVRSNVSRALTAVTRGADAKSMELKEKMTQCTG